MKIRHSFCLTHPVNFVLISFKPNDNIISLGLEMEMGKKLDRDQDQAKHREQGQDPPQAQRRPRVRDLILDQGAGIQQPQQEQEHPSMTPMLSTMEWQSMDSILSSMHK